VQRLLAILKHAAKRMVWVSEANQDEAAAATGWLAEYVQARKAFKAALLAQTDADHAEQRRMIAILERAAHDILQGPSCKQHHSETFEDSDDNRFS